VFTFQLAAQLSSSFKVQPKAGQNGICLSRDGFADATNVTCTHVTQTTWRYAKIDACALRHGSHATLLVHPTADDNALSNSNS